MPNLLLPEPAAPVSAMDPTQVVREQVLHLLGTPRDLLQVQVKPTWGDHYRVNVYREEETGRLFKRAYISDSFHVTVLNGLIVHSEPPIPRRYR